MFITYVNSRLADDMTTKAEAIKDYIAHVSTEDRHRNYGTAPTAQKLNMVKVMRKTYEHGIEPRPGPDKHGWRKAMLKACSKQNVDTPKLGNTLRRK